MKYYKFEKKGSLIQVTFKTCWGKLIVKDVYSTSSLSTTFKFMDSGDYVSNSDPIYTFYKSGYEKYIVNGKIN